jgi:hypothetical protein
MPGYVSPLFEVPENVLIAHFNPLDVLSRFFIQCSCYLAMQLLIQTLSLAKA